MALVQSVRASGNSGSTASATLASTAAGNLLVALVDCEQNPGNPTITAPANWLQANTTVTQNIFIALNAGHFYYKNNPGGLTTVTFTFSVAVSAWHIELLEISGMDTASPLDVSALRSQQATLSPSSGSVTTTAAGDFVIGWMIEDDVNGAYTLTQPGGWTALPRNQDAGAWASQYSAYQVQSAAGAIQYNPTLTSTATDSIVGILAFKAAASGAAIAGQTNGVGTAALTLTVSHNLVGESDGVGNATLALTVSHLLTGEADGVSAPTLALTVSHLLVGESDGVGAATLSLTVARGMAGTAAGVGTATLTLVTGGINGQANGVGVATLALTVTRGMAGQADGVGGATLALVVARGISGEADGVGTAALTLIIITQGVRLHGTTVVRVAPAATLIGATLVRPSSTVAAAATLARPFTGATVVRPSTDATATTAPHAPLAGSTLVRGG